MPSQVSYACGTSGTPLMYRTIGAALDHTASRFPDAEAAVFPQQNIRWTYAELQKEVQRVSAGFIALGLEPGHRIGIWSPNSAEWLLTQLASAKAGLVLVTLNPAYRLSEIEYALKKSSCRALVLAERFKSSDYIGMLKELIPELAGISDPVSERLETARFPFLNYAIVVSEGSHEGFLCFSQIGQLADSSAVEKLRQIELELEPDDPINIQFTSGTTGFPKGATLTHHNILNNGFFVAERQGFTEKDRLCIPVPLYHCFGMVMGVLGCLTHGSTMVFPGEAFDPLAVLETIQAEKCTALYGVPTMFIAELEHESFDEFDLSTLRTGVMAGSPCPVEVMKRVICDMHMSEVTICYGMTETSPVSFQSMTDDPLEKRVGTVGQVHPYVEVKIVDEYGKAVNRGEQGELCTRGYSVMLGYWDDDERTREAIDQHGWMHTGDLARMDEEGYVNITGRVKDMIIRGGENVYPREIEEFLYGHPDIQDVQVFGVPDERFGEEIACWIIAKPGVSLQPVDIEAYCKGAIAHYKVPRHIRIVDAFPMTVTGKVQKFVMRDEMKQMLGRQEQKTA